MSPSGRGQISLGALTFEVMPFEWPAPTLRTTEHVTSEGRLIEIDPTPRFEDINFKLEGTDITGWAHMTESMKAAIEADYLAGAPLLLQDWRGNAAMVMHREHPKFDPAAQDDQHEYFTFTLELAWVGEAGEG